MAFEDEQQPAQQPAPLSQQITADPLQQSLRQAQGIPPDRAERILDLRERTGLSADLIERNFDELDAKAKTNTLDVETLRRISPSTASWLEQDSRKAAAAQGQVPTLQSLERTVNAASPLLRGIDMLQGTLGGFVEWTGESTGIETIREYGRRTREVNMREADLHGPRLTFAQARRSPGEFSQWLYQTVGEQLPQMAPSLAGGAAGAWYGSAGGPWGTAIGGLLGAFAPGMVTGIGEVQTALKEKDPLASAPMTVFLGGSAIAALDSALPGKVGGKMVRLFGAETAEAVAKRVLTKEVKARWVQKTAAGVATGMTLEGLTEAFQEAIGEVASAQGAGVALEPGQVREAMVEAGAGGAVMGGLFGGAGGAADARTQSRRAAAAQQQESFFKVLGGQITDSQILNQMPQQAREFLAHATKDGPIKTVYLPTDQFEEYFQAKGENPALVAEAIIGERDAFDRAKREGTLLAIPIELYATKVAATEHQAFFARELKLRPDIMNVREVQELEELTAAAADVDAPAVREGRAREAAAGEEIARKFATMAIEQGSPQWQADAWGRYMAARYVVRARRKGADALELFASQPIEVVRQEASGASLMPSPVVDAGNELGIPRSRAPKRETVPQFAARREAHVAALASSLLRDAQRIDPQVDPAQLRAELDFRIEYDQEQQQLERESGEGQDLLRAIAGYGGMWWGRSGGERGELEKLLEDADIQDRFRAGVRQRTNRPKWNGVEGVVVEGGLTPDDMLTSLRQDARFQHLESLNDLWDAIDRARLGGQTRDELPGSEDLARLGIVPGTRWWDANWRDPLAGQDLQDVPRATTETTQETPGFPESDSVDTGEGDVSFDPDEFQQVVDDDESLLTDEARAARAAAAPAMQRVMALPEVDSVALSLPAPARRVPFPVVEGIPSEQLYRASFALVTAQPVETPVAVKDLVATQQWFFPNVVRKYLEDPEERAIADAGKPPLAMRYQGRYYLTDGHHRAIAEWAQGKPTMTVRVVDVDEAALAQELAPPGGGTAGPVVTPSFIPKAGVYGVGQMPTAPATADEGLAARQRIEAAREAARADVDAELAGADQSQAEPTGSTELYQLDERNTPDGWEVVAPYLSPAEASRLRADTAKALIDVFDSLPRDVDFEDAAKAGVAKKGWYERSGAAIQAVFGPVDGLRFTALLAALSPQTEVESNFLNTVRMWNNWTDAGRPTDPAVIERLLARSVRGTGEAESVLDSWIDNVVRALTTEDAGTIVLSGPKVQSFMRNLLGDMQAVTNDAWMANFALLDKAMLSGRPQLQASGEKVRGPNPPYLAMSAKIRRVAQTLTRETGETWTPAHVQETVWSWAKTLYELAAAEETTPSKLLREGGLTDAAIAQTPDFEQLMVNDAPVREILEAAGYGPVLSAFEKDAAKAARRRDGKKGGRRGAARGARGGLTPGLLRSARRLDELQRQRFAESLAKRERRQAERRRLARDARVAERRKKAGRRRGEFYQEVEAGEHDLQWLGAPAFYSRLEVAVREAKFERATGAQWKGVIRNSKRGINQEEFRLVAVDELEDDTQYTRAQVLTHLATHQIVVELVELQAFEPLEGAALDSAAEKIWHRMLDEKIDEIEDRGGGYQSLSEGDFEVVEDEHGDWYARWHQDGQTVGSTWTTEEEARTEALEEVDKINDSQQENFRSDVANQVSWEDAENEAREKWADEFEGREAKYSGYVMPGGDEGSYREVFLTAPNVTIESDAERLRILENARDGWLSAAADEEMRTPAEREKSANMARIFDKLIFAEDFTPGPKGFKTLTHAENAELQYQNAWVLTALREPGKKWDDGHDEYASIVNPIVRVRFNTHTSADGTKTLFLEEVQAPQEEQFKRMPALFQKTWREIAMKWALHRAAATGHHRVAWTTGDMQAKRYDLRRVASEVVYYPGSGQLAAYDDDGGELRRVYDVTPDKLPRYLGREGAERILAQKPEVGANARSTVQFELGLRVIPVDAVDGRRWVAVDADYKPFTVPEGTTPTPEAWTLMQGFHSEDQARDALHGYLDAIVRERAAAGKFSRSSPVRYTLRGEGLEFGGEGLKRLYDTDFPTVVNGLRAVKRTGGKATRMGVPFGRLEMPMPARMGEDRLIPDNFPNYPAYADAQRAQDARIQAAAAEWRAKHPPQDANREVPGIEMTPALREELLGGQELFQPDDTAPPGGRGIRGAFSPGRIRLIAGAENLSTFLHESGHAFLEELLLDATEVNLADPATTDLQRTLHQDAATALQWLGFQGTTADFLALPVDAKREMHEQWANGFEAYLMTGKAPSPELRELFAKFRAWLVAVYKVIRRYGTVDRAIAEQVKGVRLSDEIVGVMDRLLASDEAIAAVQTEGQVSPLFTDPASAGVDPLTFAAYQKQIEEASRGAREALDRRLLEDWRRERQAWWTQEREKVVDEVAAEAARNPVFVALSVMRTGKMPDGSIPTFGDGRPMKLSKSAIVSMKGAEFPKRLPRPYLYTVEGGLHPDVMAELLGFSSGDALLESLIGARPMQPIVNAEADRQMRERHGDVLLDGIELQELAEQAVHDNRAQVIAAELKALTQGMAGASIPSTSALRAQAKMRIAATRVRDLKPGLFLQAAQRASRQAFEAFARNDRAAAVRAKQQELASLALYREAAEAKDRAQKSARLLQEMQTSKGRRTTLLHAGQDYLDQVDALLERYEFTKTTQRQIERRTSLRAWLKRQEDKGLPVSVPDWIVDDARQVNYTQLTVDELEGLRASIDAIVHVARLKDKLLRALEKRTLNEVVTEIAGSIRANHGERKKTIEPRLAVERTKKFITGLGWSHRKIASIARELDGFQDGGPMFENVIRRVNDAGNREASMNASAGLALRGIFRKHYTPSELAGMTSKKQIRELGDDVSLSKQALLMLALNQGNDQNRQRLRDGYGWTQEQVQAALDAHLDKRDWEFAQDVWTYIDTYWPAIVEKQSRVIGAPPEKVPATPVFTRFGEFAGGYFPIKFERELSGRVFNLEDAAAADMAKAAAYVHSTTQRGHLERRVDGPVTEHPVRLDFGVIWEHVGQVIHDLTHHEMLLDVGRILGSEEVEAAIRETVGIGAYEQFRTALHDIAVGEGPAKHEGEGLLRYLRNGATIVGLGWNGMTTALQLLGFNQSVKRIGAKWVAKGVGSYLRGAFAMEGTVKAVINESEMMRNRADTMSPEISSLHRALGIDTGRFTGALDAALRGVSGGRVSRQGVADSFLYMITRVQFLGVDMPTYLGARAKAAADPANRNEDGTINEQKVIAIAEQAVLDAQGGGQIKDLAAIQRGSPAWKLWTNFYSFFNTTYNLWAESVRSKGGAKKIATNPIAVGRLAADVFLLFTLPTVMSHLLRSAIHGSLGDELEEPDELIVDLAKEQLAYMLGTMVILREIGGAIQGYTNYDGPAGARGVAALTKLATQAMQGKADEAFWRALNQAAGVAFHYPAGQVDRTLRGLLAFIDGTAGPQAIVFGPPPRDR